MYNVTITLKSTKERRGSMSRRNPRPRNEEMYKAILQLKTIEECLDFFEDICAETELRSIEQRYEVASMLNQNMVYSDIIQKTNASTATISRVNRVLNGGTGMLKEVLDTLQNSEE